MAPPPQTSATVTPVTINDSNNFYLNDLTKVTMTAVPKTVGGYKISYEYPFLPVHGDKIVNQSPSLKSSFVNGPGLPVSAKIKFTPDRFSITVTEGTYGMKAKQEKWAHDFFAKMRLIDEMNIAYLMANSRKFFGETKSREAILEKYKCIVQRGKLIKPDDLTCEDRYDDSIEIPILTGGTKGNKIIGADMFHRRPVYNKEKKRDEFKLVEIKSDEKRSADQKKADLFKREFLSDKFVQISFEITGMNQHQGSFKTQLCGYEMKIRPMVERLPSTSMSTNDYDDTTGDDGDENDDTDQYSSYIQGHIPANIGDNVVSSKTPLSPPPASTQQDDGSDQREVGGKSSSRNDTGSQSSKVVKTENTADQDDGMCNPSAVSLEGQ